MPVTRTLIRGGVLVDGTGATARRADLLIEGDRVADLGADLAAAKGDRTIDAAGLVISPGFVDLHSHADLILTLPPDRQRDLQRGRLAQGITTEIIGNCGLGVFPCAAESMIEHRAIVAWMTPPDCVDWPRPAWSDLASYADRVGSQGLWSNVGALQPHGPLRVVAAGLSRTPATSAAVARMTRALEEALDAGAFGLTTGLIYPPGIFTEPAEIEALAKVVRARGGARAFMASHIRGSSETLLPAVEELIGAGRRTGVRVHHSHNEAVGRGHWHKIEKVLTLEQEARAAGVEIAYDMFPYTAAATMMVAIYPPWALEGGVDRLLERLGDPAQRRAIAEAIDRTVPSWPPWTPEGWPHNLVKAVGWDGIVVGSVATEEAQRFEGMSLADLGRATAKSPFDAISDLMIAEQGRVSQLIHEISGEEGQEQGIEMLLTHPAGAICTDANDYGKGRPHPAAYGTYPRVLGRYVRDRGRLTLEEAVHKATGYPASLLGLRDRGVVRKGAYADLVLFDPVRVGSAAGFDAPRRLPEGIRCVLVNGREVWPGTGAGAPPGRFLRREG